MRKPNKRGPQEVHWRLVLSILRGEEHAPKVPIVEKLTDIIRAALYFEGIADWKDLRDLPDYGELFMYIPNHPYRKPNPPPLRGTLRKFVKEMTGKDLVLGLKKRWVLM